MNPHDDSTDDQLAARLRREALAERPPFSPVLHQQILHSLSNKPEPIPSPRTFRPWLAAAAALLLISGLSTIWIHSRAKQPTQEVTDITAEPSRAIAPQLDADVSTLNLNFNALFAGNLPLPDIAIHLPLTGDSISLTAPAVTAPPEPSSPKVGVPEMLFALMQEPATGASASLSDILPQDIRLLAAALHPQR